MKSSSPITFVIIGAGNRGSGYGGYLLEHPTRGRVVAVADPRPEYRTRLAAAHGIADDMVFKSWEEVSNRGKIADAAIITTPDRVHRAPAEALSRLGYHVLLEKPVAPTLEDTMGALTAARDAAKRHGSMFAVCHVLLYTEYTRALKHLVESGAIGDLVSINTIEPVGFWHFAHSFVRGNWHKESESSFSLLAKSCHDIDWFRHFMGSDWESVSSFGSLVHFRPEHRPAGAADRCLECAVESDCVFSAREIYLGRVARGDYGWPVPVLTSDLTPDGVRRALETGPYGECVYLGRNDVCDNQTVSIAYPGGRTVTFNMVAFTNIGHRRNQFFGTRGELRGNGESIELFDFTTESSRLIEPGRYLRDVARASASKARAGAASAAGGVAVSVDADDADAATAKGGHGGGDYGLMDAFLAAIETGDPTPIVSGADASLSSHALVFAAEAARRANRVVTRAEFETAHGLR